MVYTIGETVLDIIFRGDQPVTAKAGGSMLNASVSLGRAGIPVTFISELGSDRVAEMITGFLEKNRVSVNFIQSYPGTATPVALAFLDEHGDASYSFYRDFPGERLTIRLPQPGPDDIILFGSFFSVSPEVRESLSRFLRGASENNALIIYDPNFRKQHLGDLEKSLPLIEENINFASVIRGSDEDFLNIFGAEDVETAYKRMKGKILICTRNKEEVQIITPDFRMNVPVPAIDTVSTIGAGDAFNAGITCELIKMKINRKNIFTISSTEWEHIISVGIRFASDVCRGWDNYISKEFFHTFV